MPAIIQIAALAVACAFSTIYLLADSKSRRGLQAKLKGHVVPERDSFFRLTVCMPEVSPASETMLLESKQYLKTYRETARYLDLRATGILGLIGAGSSLWLTLGGAPTFVRTVQLDLIAGLIAVGAAVVGAMMILMQRPSASPNLFQMLDPSLLKRASGNATIMARLSWEYLNRAQAMQPIVARKFALVNVAQTLFISGLFLMFVGSLMQPTNGDAAGTSDITLSCGVHGAPKKCTIEAR
jgi:hypothetical protein